MSRIRDYDTDELLSPKGEEPDSQRAYAISRELQRRAEHDRVELHAHQMAVGEWQIKASRAAIATARWVRASAIAVIMGTVIAVLTYLEAVL